jgi:hypothetical protein
MALASVLERGLRIPVGTGVAAVLMLCCGKLLQPHERVVDKSSCGSSCSTGAEVAWLCSTCT